MRAPPSGATTTSISLSFSQSVSDHPVVYRLKPHKTLDSPQTLAQMIPRPKFVVCKERFGFGIGASELAF